MRRVSTAGGHWGRGHRSLLGCALWLRGLVAGRGTVALAMGGAAMLAPSVAQAAPVRATGVAKASEWKQPPKPTVVRARALRRARTRAIVEALGQIEGADAAAKKQVMGSHSAWTSAYRIVDEVREGGTVRLQIDVDVDMTRLTKRVTGGASAAASARPRFSLGTIKASENGACGPHDALVTAVREELTTAGAVAPEPDAGTAAIDLLITCDRLGAVRYTHMRAARVEVVAATEAHAVATVSRDAFADVDDAAVDSGLSAALFAVGARLSAHQRGRMTVHVQAPGPGDRIRRLERAIRDDVLGVSSVRVSGLTRGGVTLTLNTNLDPEIVAKRLSALRLPDFSVTIVGTEEPDGVTIRLH